MGSNKQFSAQNWTNDQVQYNEASFRTYWRTLCTASLAAGLIAACALRDPLGIGITGFATAGFGAAAIVAKRKENKIGKELDRLGLERPGYISMR